MQFLVTYRSKDKSKKSYIMEADTLLPFSYAMRDLKNRVDPDGRVLKVEDR